MKNDDFCTEATIMSKAIAGDASSDEHTTQLVEAVSLPRAATRQARPHDGCARLLADIIWDDRLDDRGQYPSFVGAWGVQSSSLGDTTSVAEHPFVLWDGGVFASSRDGSGQSALVIDDLRAWLPTVGLREIGFGRSPGRPGIWCMLVACDGQARLMAEADIYRITEVIGVWMDARYVAAGVSREDYSCEDDGTGDDLAVTTIVWS